MPHVHDCILTATGGPTVNEGLISFYQAGGATADQLQDAEREFLIAKGVAGRGHNQDMWMEYWDTLSVPGNAYPDRWKNYWCGYPSPT